MAADASGETKKTTRVADRFRELILSGEWEDGHTLPSERDLAAEQGVSVTTMRRAIDVLVGEGLIDKGQGRPSRVSNREPAYRLVIKLHQAQAGYLVDGVADRVAEPPLAFSAGSETGAERREWSQAAVAVPKRFAALLGLEPGARMIERVMKLAVDGEPILTSTSYLPPELAHNGDGWQDVEVGQLALVGHPVSAELMEEQSRMPTPAQRAALGMPKGVSVKIISYPCQVLMADRTLPAGVIVLARSDRVRLRWYRPEPLGWAPE
ncbi:MAG TPA: GntR family transcriptional regulator [Pseudonocardiaceae bacterium]